MMDGLCSPEGKTQGSKTNWWFLLEHFYLSEFIIIIYFKGKRKRVKGYRFSSGYPKPQEGSLQRPPCFSTDLQQSPSLQLEFPHKNLKLLEGTRAQTHNPYTRN